MKTVIKTRKFNKEIYTFELNTMISWTNRKEIEYISCTTPKNCFGYEDHILLNSKNQAYTLHRYLPKWILKKCEEIMIELQEKYCESEG